MSGTEEEEEEVAAAVEDGAAATTATAAKATAKATAAAAATVRSVRELKRTLEECYYRAGGRDSERAKGDVSVNVERVRDVLALLDRETRVTLPVLRETLIGATVNKYRGHPELGPAARALVAKWKRAAAAGAGENGGGGGKAKKKKMAAAAAKRKEEAAEEEGAEAAAAPPAAKGEPAERRGSLRSVSSGGDDDGDVDPDAAFAGLYPEQRQSIGKKLLGLFRSAAPVLVTEHGVNRSAVDHLAVSRGVELEAAVYAQNVANKKGYADKARSIFFNLKKNQSLVVRVMLGQVTAEELVNYSTEQLASKELRERRASQAARLLDSRRLDWDEANEDRINEQCGIKGDLLQASLFTCGRCKSTKTTSTQKQTRSADEPMTVFVLCLNCGKRWRC